MKSIRRTRSCLAVVAVLLVSSTSVNAGAVDDLINLINTVNGLLASAKQQAKAAAQNAYDSLSFALQTAPDSVTSVAAANAQAARNRRAEINALLDNTIVVPAESLSATLPGIQNCINGMMPAASETVKIIDALTAARPRIRSELDAARRAAPGAFDPIQGSISLTALAVDQLEKLSSKMSTFSGAIQTMSKECNDIILAVSERRYRDLAAEQQHLQQAKQAIQQGLRDVQALAASTQAALGAAKQEVQNAKSSAAVTAGHLQNALNQIAGVLSQVQQATSLFSGGCNTCTTAVDQWITWYSNLMATARQAFLDSLPPEVRSAISSLDQTVSRAESFASAVGTAVGAALAAARAKLYAAESDIATAVSASITAMVKFLQSFLTHSWELNMTQLTADVNNLVTQISTQVAAVAKGVMDAAAPKRTEAETQLNNLAAVNLQLTQLYQRLYQIAVGPTVVLRSGFVLAAPRMLTVTAIKVAPVNTTGLISATSSTLNTSLAPLVQKLSTSVAEERLRRGVK